MPNQGAQAFPEPPSLPSQDSGAASIFSQIHRLEHAMNERENLQAKLSLAKEWLRAIQKQFPDTRNLVYSALAELD